jgi:PST family polysaccharide transporter
LAETTKNHNSYGGIFKAIALFGGVKLINIFISILQSKAIAVLIGPTGMGISNLLKSTTDTVNRITGCGLHTSAVRDVAKSYHEQDQDKINVTITTVRGLVWTTGLLGAFLVLAFAGSLSQFAFGNREYTAAFRILSIMLVFLQINVGQIALMQGTFHYKDMAKANLIGHVLSLVLTLPLYYFFREKGIVPALIIASLITLILTTIYSRKIHYEKVKLSIKEYWKNGKDMLTVGFVIALGGLISNASSYLMNVIISRVQSVEAVGLYSAAITIANSYVFLILSAMTTDYVPRLSAINGNNEEQVKTINKQMEMVVLLLTPLLVTFIVFAREVIWILYTPKFYAVTHMMEFLMFGMLYRAISWCLSYAFIARGDSKIFLTNEIIIFFISLSCKFIGFYFFGFTGIGVAIIVVYLVYTAIMAIVAKKRFGFSFDNGFMKLTLTSTAICFTALMVSYFGNIHWWKYAIGVMMLFVAVYYSYKELDQRMNIKAAFSKLIKKKTGKNKEL